MGIMKTLWLLLFIPCLLISRPLDVQLKARSAILINANTGAVLFEKDPYAKAYPASITKTATALYLIENQNLPLDQKLKVSAEALKMRPTTGSYAPHQLIPDGSTMSLQKGELVSVEALLHGLMLISGNDAANVLAEAHSGSIPRFVEELNRYLQEELGCKHTQFCNPHGVHFDEHYSCAYDLSLIAKRALSLPKFREIVSKTSYMCPQTNKRAAREIEQKNALLKKGRHYYPKAIGIKTGYYSHAMNTLIAAAEHEGRTLIAVLLGCPKNEDRFQDAILLFETAFQETRQTQCLLSTVKEFSREIPGMKKLLSASLAKDLEISYFPSEEPDCKAQIRWNPIQLPIKKGQKVGVVEILSGSNVIEKGDLIAKEDVKGTLVFMLKEKLFGSSSQKS